MLRSLRASLIVVLTFGFGACSSEDDSTDTGERPDDTVADVASDVTDNACGGCPEGKLCCPSHFQGDIPRCIDPNLNPEHCGGCGVTCNGACLDRACVDAQPCIEGDTCGPDLECSLAAGMGRCCPPGTTYIVSPADFFGCCPDGDICGCREGMCPISVRAVKSDIRYLDAGELAVLGADLLATRLATWRYRGDASGRRQLGFIIDDGGPAHAIAAGGGHVDLYGYVSLAVATLQRQAADLEQIRRELDQLRARLDGQGSQCSMPSTALD